MSKSCEKKSLKLYVDCDGVSNQVKGSRDSFDFIYLLTCFGN